VITAVFTLDLLVIHPFEDGNGRTARIASNALLARADYTVGRYVSIEQLLGDRQTSYYRSLLESTHGWHDSEHDIWPWVEFFAEVLVDAYAALDQRLANSTPRDHRDLVIGWIRTGAPASFSMSEARTAMTGIPDGAIRRALQDARSRGAIALRGTGRAARWVVLDRSQLRVGDTST